MFVAHLEYKVFSFPVLGKGFLAGPGGQVGRLARAQHQQDFTAQRRHHVLDRRFGLVRGDLQAEPDLHVAVLVLVLLGQVDGELLQVDEVRKLARLLFPVGLVHWRRCPLQVEERARAAGERHQRRGDDDHQFLGRALSHRSLRCRRRRGCPLLAFCHLVSANGRRTPAPRAFM